ncbi:hypothetical protein BGX29_008463 [Mortierella sp. GBA35]|nr:hypothetical protein BGX23_008373 [Mortierella sp. AD031]KAF9096689.1 hypothetical protein BGX29_008463 [Mortierella sp. GBA35]KAG0201119.1 hypothetical protein BGX33_010513 [Mortierella sp. NVP41]
MQKDILPQHKHSFYVGHPSAQNRAEGWCYRRVFRNRTIVLFLAIVFFIARILNPNFEFRIANNSTEEDDFDYITTTTTTSQSSLTLSPGPIEPAFSLLDPNTKYLSFMPFAGITNQFIALQGAAFAAKRLNRTLIIPPIISNTHDHENTHQPWSQFFDLPRFTELTGVPVLEWSDVRPLDPLQYQLGVDYAARYGRGPRAQEWNELAQNITCQIVYGYGAPDLDINISARYFMWHFLMRPNFVRPPPKKPETPVYNRTKIARDNVHEDDLVVMEDLLARYSDYEDPVGEDGQPSILFMADMFNIKDPFHYDRFWLEAGRFFHFLPEVIQYARILVHDETNNDHIHNALDDLIQQAVPIPIEPVAQEQEQEQEELDGVEEDYARLTVGSQELFETAESLIRSPYIAIHMRRGDIWKKCSSVNRAVCIIPFDLYEEAVARARQTALQAGIHEHLPVIVTTDSESEEDFQTIRDLGWHRLDHSVHGTAEKWGFFGPAVIDAVILAYSEVFVGSAKSTMTKVAALRQRAWWGRTALYPRTEVETVKRTHVMKGKVEP